MTEYFHSVNLDRGKCVGCTNCLKHCPTEAIRVHSGRAHIIDARCIDCGECIRVCQHHAKVALTNPLASINRFPYKIALPAPALYGQFKQLPKVTSVTKGLRMMGFDAVYDVARGADIVSRAVQKRLREPDCPRPLISSSCPAVLRLIQMRFPELLDNVVDVRSPMEVAAMEARRDFCKKNNVAPEAVGCFFITPCAAKMTAIRNPIGHETSAVSGAISMLEIYGLLNSQLKRADKLHIDNEEEFLATSFGLGWAAPGGEASAAGIDNALAVDGIENVARVLEEIENNRLGDLAFFEGLACTAGCVGGPLTFENAFIARNRIRALTQSMPQRRPEQVITEEYMKELGRSIYNTLPIEPINTLQLDTDLQAALRKMDQVEEIRQRLPGLDCGSCGSPTCQALAEDIVKGYAHEMDCLPLLKERIRDMAKQMVTIAENTRT
ncbi:MAG: [Fe-Fe] hydrogenase large subunit C-terminal domain-containing protein [Christensenellales bacterium]|jgi:iron only hydrogenase large subunit-like protein